MNIVKSFLAVLCLLVGILWIGQGAGVIGGSMMTGQPKWSVAGVVLVVVALSLLVSLLRSRRATVMSMGAGSVHPDDGHAPPARRGT